MATPATAAESRRKKSTNISDINPKYTIRKPHGDQFLMLDFYHLKVLGGDRNLTSVFDALLYFSNGKVKLLNAREDRKSEPWFEATEAKIRIQTGNINEKTIRGHISTLVERGFLAVKDGDPTRYGVTHQYLVNYEAMDRAVDRHFPIGSFTDEDTEAIGSFTDEPSVVLPSTIGSFTDEDTEAIGSFTDEPSVVLPSTIGSFTDLYKEEEVKEYIQEQKKENTSFLSQDQSQKLPTTEALLVTEENPLVPPAAPCEEKYSESQSNLNLEDDVLVFVRNIYKRERRITIKPKSLVPTEALIRRRESEYGPEDFRRGLICYLSQSHDSVVKKQWPISWYLSDPSKNMPDSPFPSPATPSPRPLPTSASSDATANAPTQFEPSSTQAISDPLKNPLTYIEQWNTIVYDSPVDVDAVPSFTMAGLKKAINGGDFQKCFERVFEKCQRMNASKPGMITFDGLFMGYVPMWQKIYSGTEDWKMGKEDVFAQVQAAAEREERDSQSVPE